MKPAKRAVAVAELKARLSNHLRQVKRGSELVITERGIPVAKLVPLKSDEAGGRRGELARQGILIPGKGKVRDLLRRPPEGNPKLGSAVLAALLQEREEGR
jgi:prevent-host-death family protein